MKTKTKPKQVTATVVRTRSQVRAEAKALSGAPSRIAAAAIDDGDETADAPGTSVGELWLYGVVGGWWFGFDAESVSRALRGLDVDVLYVRIHSPGGLASDGVAIGNLLRNHTAKIVVVVDGLAASAASVIAISGDEIVMCPGSQMMLHDASLMTYGNAAQLRRDADWIDGQSQNYAGVYAYKAGGTPESWREVMLANEGEGTWYTADDAVAAGLADSVGTRPASGSPPTAPEDQLDDEDEDGWAKAAHDLALLEQYVHPAARAAWQGEHHKPPSASAVGSITTHEGVPAVAFTDAQITDMRTKLGVAEDADEATILAALDEALDERAEPTSTTIPEGHVVIPAAQLADLTAGAAAGTGAAQRLHERERKEFFDANRTKYAAANRAAWEKEYDRDPEGTREHFASAPDLVPVSELGHNVETDDDDDTTVTVAGPASLKAVTESDTYQNWSM